MDINGLAAIVTGGASGLGAATAEMLSARGAKVALFDLNAAAGEAKAAEIGGLFKTVDVTDEASVSDAIAQAEAVHGKARILVNCAGIAPPAKVLSRDGSPLPLADFAKIININLIGTFNVLSKFAARIFDAEPLDADGARGVIVNTASVAAFDGQIGQPAYAASKGGVAAMALPIARELARFGIRVNTIAPGIFWTPMLASLPQDAQDSLGQQVPFPSRLGQPAEYAKLVEAIVGNAMLNGEVIRLDGAIRMAPR
ncbi:MULTISPECIES: SDR family NAD(P)-dependent oxidoreductase [unclassified Novosphingobium]|uniref:SDR family NAD(P)-dependent oxidoreductase n=1 Tax=unclassified Novosphingobium TaxID=2644732 RepID=UPI0014943A33|nr:MULTISPECIES: SDR family NAD(P)-dependent oxidoreductase [unclassified Novosphingobium]MBB3358039.1 NAD(P)-dependent dehydrogenase (short-subunit alcohol dehydrogenase family) [Novosphingobium sp. BK256]MBB3374400.1 NAD(P)-dependent dehydrogenase (short-subunit alcohol dehydrogenase family) [Novosphingobium sp. BK280]MBB3378812.1 NAD(P)-dependent dehydrogenase (short-subunit alcohol dehydrogenase family) [Novosphingobium sp. BK258]MBB3420506.1 NAD(P)-dependent dehydrogenase (short-subunit al